jgi:hypothetical protein
MKGGILTRDPETGKAADSQARGRPHLTVTRIGRYGSRGGHVGSSYESAMPDMNAKPVTLLRDGPRSHHGAISVGTARPHDTGTGCLPPTQPTARKPFARCRLQGV